MTCEGWERKPHPTNGPLIGTTVTTKSQESSGTYTRTVHLCPHCFAALTRVKG
jgi:hypothetical protein